jgi:hypothetical protein
VCRPPRSLSHGQSQLHPTPPVKGFGQVLKGQVVNGGHDGAASEWWRGVLHVQYIDGMASQLAGKCQRDSDQRRVRQRLLDREVRPAISKPLDCCPFCYKESVKIGLIDPGQSLDQVDGVTFIAAQLRSDGMSIDCDT